MSAKRPRKRGKRKSENKKKVKEKKVKSNMKKEVKDGVLPHGHLSKADEVKNGLFRIGAPFIIIILVARLFLLTGSSSDSFLDHYPSINFVEYFAGLFSC